MKKREETSPTISKLVFMPRTWNIVPGIAWKGGGLKNKRLETKLSLKGHSKPDSNSFFFALIKTKIGVRIKKSV